MKMFYIDKYKNRSMENKLLEKEVSNILREIDSFLLDKNNIKNLVLDEHKYNWLRNVLFMNLKLLLKNIKEEEKKKVSSKNIK